MTIGSYLLDKLQRAGVRHIFGVPGDYILRFNKLIEEHAIQFVNATRENTAGYMAEAYARFANLGVVCITYGVGLNIANAVTQAYVEDVPLIIISGAPGKKELAKSPLLHHLVPKKEAQAAIFRNITAYQAILHDPLTAQKEIDTAIATALSLKKPVYIEIPRDAVLAPLEIKPSPQASNSSDPKQLHDALQTAQEVLKNSKKPFLWLGHQILREDLSERIDSFIKRNSLPFVTSLLGKTALDERNPFFAGVYQGQLSLPNVCHFVEQSDCAIILGVILSDLDTGLFTAKLDQPNQITAKDVTVQINGKTFTPVLFKDFVDGLVTLHCQGSTPPAKTSVSSHHFAQSVFDSLQDFIGSNFIVAADIGDSLFGSADFTLPQNSFLSSAYFGTMGYAIPAAIGAQFAAGKRSIAIVGDGSFQMTGTELSTAARYGLNPIIIVLNNHGYGTERPLLEGAYNDIHNWDYTAITALLQNGTSYKVETIEALKEALQEAAASKELALIEVKLGKTDFSDAMHRFSKVMEKTVKG